MSKSLKRHEGWVMLDHSASPGLPADFARLMGLDPRFTGEGQKFEAATLTCPHCGGAWIKNPLRTRPRDYCRKCDHYICGGCAYIAAQPGYVHACFKQVIGA
jgi:hypothetical protein